MSEKNNLYSSSKNFNVKFVDDYSFNESLNAITEKKHYVKSPLNYIGGKFKLLNQIIPLFPSNIETFVDLFCGGCNVGINSDSNKVIFNDNNTILVEMFNFFKDTRLQDLILQIEEQITTWDLSVTNEDGYKKFRDFYNQTRNPIDLYTLSCFSFNYQLRFNNKHEYNNPFGRNRSHFSSVMKDNFIDFVKKIHEKNVWFSTYDFYNFPFHILKENDFVYCDPPYLITTGSYNDGNRGFKDWSEDYENKLYSVLDMLNEKNIRFALSNVFEHKGKANIILKKWATKYKVIHLQKDYSNSCYNTKRMKSDEVLVINY